MSTNIDKMFGTDKNIEKNGIVLDYGEFQLTVARAGGSNQAYNKRLEQITKPYRRAIENETMDQKLSMDILMQVYAETVVLGWEGVTDDKGKDVPFSKEACLRMFQNNQDFFLDVQSQATKMVLFKKNIQEIEAGN